MALRNSRIQEFFKPLSQLQADPVGANNAEVDPVEADSKESDSLEAVSSPEPAAKHSSKDRVITSSDKEDSGSDSSMDDIYVALQLQSRPKHSNSAANGSKPPETSRARNKRKRGLVLTSPSKPKYKFDMKTLIEEAERHKATEASALSMKALLEDGAGNDSQGNTPEAARDIILQSVIAEKEKESDGIDAGKYLQAVKRTESVRVEKGWYFFDSVGDDVHAARPLPAHMESGGWKAMLADPQSREQVVLSGFARDMVGLGDTLNDDLFKWMLDEICFEHRDNLREAYCKVLAATDTQVRKVISCKVIKSLFRNLGGKNEALDISGGVKFISKDQSPYEGRNWTTFSAVIAFIGRISWQLSADTCSYTICVLTRLCIDTVVVENISLLAVVQKTIEQVSGNFEDANWEKNCQEICSSIFCATKLPALQLQVLRCIPQTTRRVHELRRRLALAFFFDTTQYISNASHDALDLSAVTQQLEKPLFKINKETDYPELAATMSILNIAIDDGLSVKHDAARPESEVEFNKEVDILAARIKQIWGSINDAGASFMSRSYAKEMMEGLRMRLELTVRTKPKPKLSIFETDGPDEGQVVLKQTTLSRKLFQKKPLVEDIR